MGFTRIKSKYFGIFGILAAITYVAVFYMASGSVTNWTFGTSDPSDFLKVEKYRYGLMAAGALGAAFGIGFVIQRDNALQVISGITAIFAGVTLAIIGYQAPSVGDNFVLIFSALLIATALLDAVSGAVNGQYVSLVLSLMLALIMAATYYFDTMYGTAFIIAALIWLLLSALVMIVYNPDLDSVSARKKTDAEPTPEQARKAELEARRERRAEARAAHAAASRKQPAEKKQKEASEETDGDFEEDVYTDNSPEALVRRAAWNKGLRCRRDYGEDNIPAAFVGAKVAVYVVPKDTDIPAEEKLKSKGWTVLIFDEGEVTDGTAQAETISDTVKEIEKSRKDSKKKPRK